jgi:glycosyltransferase involved in cell wall biosynthesis
MILGNKLNIICVGQITHRKGQIYLIEAVNKLKEQGIDADLTLVGLMDPIYYQIIQKKQLERKFTHIPHVDNSEMIKLLSEYNLMVVPSIEDGFGVVVTEGLSAGLPVIATSSCGASEILNSRNGAVIPAGDVEQLVHHLNSFLNRTFTWEQDFMDWQDYSKKLGDIYSNLVKI